jgi:lipoate-protein ligase A
MILWLDGGHDAPENMARDEELLARCVAGSHDIVLRLFTFVPAGITLGRAQDPAQELDLDRLARDGVRWARRPTGGRAIWHDEEWTFSLVTPLAAGDAGSPPDPRETGWAATPAEAYARTGALLTRALQRLGVPASLAPGSPRGPGAPRERSGAAPPCFASTARHELVLGGRKLAGIAQRAVRGALLQQGSLLLGDSHVRLADFVRVSDEQRAGLREAWREGAATAGHALGDDWSLSRLAAAIAAELPAAERLEGEAGARRLGITRAG